MAFKKWPARVEVQFTEVGDQINALIYDRFSRKILAAFQSREPEAIMRRVRQAHEEHRAEAVFLRPWPYRMEKFIRRRIINATRQKLADSGSNIAGGEMSAKGK